MAEVAMLEQALVQQRQREARRWRFLAVFISQAVKPRHLWRGYKAALACEPVLRNAAVYISSVITQSRQL